MNSPLEALTPRQHAFVRAYLACRNATKAAIEAGYSEKTAAVQGARLLKNAKVQAAVGFLQQPIFNRYDVSVERNTAELAKIAFSSMGDYMRVTSDGVPYLDLSDLTDQQKSAIAEFQVEDFTVGRGENARDVRRVKLKLHDKLGALEKLGRQLAMFGGKAEDDRNSMEAQFYEMLMRAQGTALPIKAASAKPNRKE